jgi:Putative abortive phage resistance protein AbiGi, antitoxin
MARSDFLVHWTGKDICTDCRALTADNRQAYVDLLLSIMQDGFWMTVPREQLIGNYTTLQYDIPMTCFTEIKLSQTQAHVQRYGLLGVGVSRRFVLDRLGGPVHYVRNHQDEFVVANTFQIFEYFRKTSNSLVGHSQANLCFLKAMSNPGTDDFEVLNENEWRIIETEAQVIAGNLLRTGKARPRALIPLKGETRLVVFPDDRTRSLALINPTLKTMLQGPSGVPMLLTIEECEHF